MSFKKILCFCILTAFACSVLCGAGCGGGGVQIGSGPEIAGSSTVETREMNYSGFSKVAVGYQFEVEITQAEAFSVSVTLNENLFEYLNMEVEDDTLSIGFKTGNTFTGVRHSVAITMPELAEIDFHGAVKGNISGFSSTGPLKVSASGDSTLDFSDMKVGDAEFIVMTASDVNGSMEMGNGSFRVTGTCKVTLAGSANDIVVDVKTSYLTLEKFTVANASVMIDAGGTVTLNASGRIEGEARGRSKFYYVGSPAAVDVEKVGGSIIEKK